MHVFMHKAVPGTIYPAPFIPFTGHLLPRKFISDIRDALSTGLVLGNERLREEVEQLTGEREGAAL